MPFALDDAFALIESPDGMRVFSGLRRAAAIRSTEDLDALLAPGGEARVVALDYEFGYLIEPRAGEKAADDRGWVWTFGETALVRPPDVDAYLDRVCATLSEDLRCAAVCAPTIGLDEAAYVAGVEKIQAWIAAGDCYQVNFSFPLRLGTIGHPLAVFAALRKRQRGTWSACIVTPQRRIVSCSPELFVRRQGDELICRPMKGTRPRGADSAGDAALRQELDAAAKDRAENVMIVDLLRNDLGRIAVPGSVCVDGLFEVESYPTVHQMVSSIRARAPGCSMAKVIRALFPCGSITGAPKVRAMQIIAELEQEPRGIYTGAIGTLLPDDDFALNVAIRTLDLHGDGSATLGVGSGIVADSVPADEYRECLLKAQFATGMRPNFGLIETMRLEDGEVKRRGTHLARLARSAGQLGFPLDPSAVDQDLQRHADAHPRGVYRLRLRLTEDGKLATTVSPLEDLPDSQQIRISAQRLDSSDHGLRFKTTRRALYNEALRALPPGVFDVIFLNQRDELCEGARSNLFLQIDNRLLTPSLNCGLLPGVLRAELLKSGQAIEAVLGLDDLRRAEAIFVGNALRGLVPVTLPD